MCEGDNGGDYGCDYNYLYLRVCKVLWSSVFQLDFFGTGMLSIFGNVMECVGINLNELILFG